MSKRAQMLAGLLSVSGLLGCGEPLVDGRYRGEPLMVVEGDVLFLDEPPEELPAAELRVAVFWSAAGALQDDTIEAVDSIQEQVVTTGSFPARYQMYIYTPPPESLLEEVPGAEGQRAVIGMVLLYLDVDGNQRWSGAEAFEPIIGGAQDEVILYAPEGIEGDVVDEPLADGFHAVAPYRDDLCIGEEDEQLVPLDPSDPSSIDLVVGPEIDSLLFDLDCDALIDEWCSTCPSPAQLDIICEQTPSYCAEELDHCLLCE